MSVATDDVGKRTEDRRLGAVRELTGRDVAALTEPMNVFADDPEARTEEVAVYNGGTRYIVNPIAGYCTCDDWHFRQPDGGCKHRRRVQFATGERAVPAAIDRDALDRNLRERLDE